MQIKNSLQKIPIQVTRYMKIALVANTCWNIYNFRKGLVNHFISHGNEVVLLAPGDEYTEQLQEWGIKWIDMPLDRTGASPIKDLRYLKALYSAFKLEKPDVALGFTIKSSIYACLASKLSMTPLICNVSGLGTVFLVKGFASEIAKWLYRMTFRFAKFIFFQNNDDKTLFLSTIKVDENKTGLLPGSGINLDEFQVSKSKSASDKVVRFLMIGRLIIEKGVREYVEAASGFMEDPRTTFTLIGKFDETHARSIDKAELEEWVSKGWIKYLPHSNNIKKAIEEHDVIVLPSYREGDTQSTLGRSSNGETASCL